MFEDDFIQKIDSFKNNISLFIQRDDLLHPIVSGNKFRKLKYNILEANRLNKQIILTFGGAFSNHIVATAFAAKKANLQSIGIIRGEELANQKLNKTLQFAKDYGMEFEFISRENYQNKTKTFFLKELELKYPNSLILPEGGSNELAVKGCSEITKNHQNQFDFIAVAVGTGTTIAGICNASKKNMKILGFPALKGDFLENEICKFAKNKNWQLITDFHFGGYAKTTPELISFLNHFYNKYKIPLDPIYTGKMMFGIFHLIENNFFPENSSIIAIHTGGLQGIHGINLQLKNKNLETIQYEF